jgi:hypothetical protein
MSVTYSIDGTTATFTGTGTLSGATADLSGATIAIIDGYTSIGPNAFDGATSLTSVTFAEGSQLTSIGEAAFVYSRLTSINFPASLISIGNYAFSFASGLTSINFPASLKTIGACVKFDLDNHSSRCYQHWKLCVR